jgi:PST family polysaccharide transporter
MRAALANSTGLSTTRKTLFSNSSWSLANQTVRVGTLALVTIALSRHFGPEQFGLLACGLALVRIFALIAGFGLDRVLVRLLVESPDDGREILRGGFWLKLAIGFVCYLSLLGFVAATAPHDRITLAIVILAGGSLLFQAFDVFDYFFQAGNRFRLTFLGRTLAVILCTGIKIAAILFGAPLLLFAMLETIEMALIAASLLLVYRATNRSRGMQGDARFSIDRRGALREGFPLLLGSLAVMIYMRSDVLLLGRMIGYQAAGIYSAASQITEGCALFPMAFLPALFPILLSWRKRGLPFYRQQFGKLFLGAVLVGCGIAACLTIGAPLIVRVLYGHAYAAAAGILVIHSWSAIFIYLSIMQSGYDITEGLTWYAVVRNAAGATANIGLNLALIPRYGAAGSAVATLIAQFFSTFLLNLAHPRTRPIFELQLRALLLIPIMQWMLQRLRKGGSDWFSRPCAAEQ